MPVEEISADQKQILAALEDGTAIFIDLPDTINEIQLMHAFNMALDLIPVSEKEARRAFEYIISMRASPPLAARRSNPSEQAATRNCAGGAGMSYKFTPEQQAMLDSIKLVVPLLHVASNVIQSTEHVKAGGDWPQYESYCATHAPKLASALLEAVEVAKSYEAWEADLILNGDWSGPTLTLTQAQHDAMIEIQTMRNAFLAKLGEK